MIRSRAETLLHQNLKQIFEMTELSEVVHTEALRETLNLRGTDEGHYICPILLVASIPCPRQSTKNQNERA